MLLFLVACAADPTTPVAGHLPEALGVVADEAAPKTVGATSTAIGASPDGGFAVVGDVNADGRADLVAVSGSSAQVFMGRPTGITTVAMTTLTASFGAGTVVAGLGDVNGDGYGDVAVGDPTASGGAGRVLIYQGGRRGLNARSSVSLAGRGTDALGAEVAGVGDVNGDGYADLALYIPGPQRVRVYYGSATGIQTTGYTSITASWHDASSILYYGGSVTGAGLAGGSDVDGDGYDDVVVSYPTWNTEDGGYYVFRGGASGVSRFGTLVTYPWPGAYSSWCDGPPYMGWSLTAGFDFDGDGYGDVLAGAPFDICDGYAYGWNGGAGGVQTSSWTEFYAFGGDYITLFATTSAAGDFNGDGYADLAFGGSAATWAQGPFLASIPESEVTTDPASIPGTEMYVSGYDYYDYRVATRVSAGDINGDGYDDVATAVYTASGWSATVYWGSP